MCVCARRHKEVLVIVSRNSKRRGGGERQELNQTETLDEVRVKGGRRIIKRDEV